ncbi:DoxX family membrane protein [Membranicola marinus]|uniref:DoxX family membrane protein n=1 Tax=Membranihabitans marinus TaxID=1227546 RepID=A0A953HSS1_9BACT|nr:DoxX family membrane protein [Membranihabitans marinus]MBY5957243.1 DoxX family membrane protein [Membranihabitans marinus]
MKENVQFVRTILKYTFGIVPIVAGLDKFTNLLTDWSDYLATWMSGLLPMSPDAFMMVVGVIEIIAGVLVFTKTKMGAYIVMAWLIGITLTLIIGGQFLDVAIRDLVMAVAAYCLAVLHKDSNE